MIQHFCNKPFLWHQYQAFPQYEIIMAYTHNKNDFRESVKTVPLCEVPSNANMISSYVVYKITVNDDHSFKLKACIVPHGNEDDVKYILRSDCSMCSPASFPMVVFVALLMKLWFRKINVNTAFLQTPRAERDVYVILPTETEDRGKWLWLSLVASYGLMNANAKWHSVLDLILTNIWSKLLSMVPQRFIMVSHNGLMLLLAEIVDDFLICGPLKYVVMVISKLKNHFELVTTSRYWI